jgi:hypothetical protein
VQKDIEVKDLENIRLKEEICQLKKQRKQLKKENERLKKRNEWLKPSAAPAAPQRQLNVDLPICLHHSCASVPPSSPSAFQLTDRNGFTVEGTTIKRIAGDV